jgi:MFS transporter, DHA2 family, multidrug resistance protein
MGEDAAAPPRRSVVTFGLMIATSLQAADALVVNVALPQLQHDLGGGLELGTWVITSYLCATAVMAPLTGWLRRRYGARRLFPGAVGGFALASLLCALAPSVSSIIVFRILQGAAGGVIHPLAQAILLDIYPTARHARMLAMLGAGVMAGPILGPPIGGVITDLTSWRWVFAINIPLGLIAIWCVSRLQSSVETARDQTIDVLGILLLVAGIAAFELLLQRGVGRSWLHSPEIIVEATITIATVVLLAWRAGRSRFSAFRPEVFRDLNFVTATFYNFMLSALLFVTIVFLPLLGEGPLGFPAMLAGAMIVPRAILLMLMLLAVGELFGRIDHRILLGLGWVLMAAGLGILSQTRPGNALLTIILGSAVQSVGAGLLFTPHSTLAFSTLAPELRTDATGLFSLVRQLGYASGVALMTAVLRMQVDKHLGTVTGGGILPPTSSPAQPLDLAALRAYRDCFRLMAVASLIVIPGIFLFRSAGVYAPRKGSAAARLTGATLGPRR